MKPGPPPDSLLCGLLQLTQDVEHPMDLPFQFPDLSGEIPVCRQDLAQANESANHL
jgi:hypothetical protein